jgi:hypothetical protein
MITILSIIGSQISIIICGIFLIKFFRVNGAILGLIGSLLSAFFAIEFYKLLCTIL